MAPPFPQAMPRACAIWWPLLGDLATGGSECESVSEKGKRIVDFPGIVNH